ncbi:MAG: catalase [Ramlibacter sp.]
MSDAPGTGWQETIAPDEAQRHAEAGRRFAAIQQRKSERYGPGRALHRKQLTAAQGTLQVLGDLPAWAAQGLFSEPGNHEVWVRLSNGGLDKARDSMPDIRGFAFRVLGVQGDSALGNGPAKSQDFTLINQEAFAFKGSAEFVDFVEAASWGNGSLLKYIVKRYGVFGLPAQLAKLARMAGKPFTGFATEKMFSAVPMANGPYAARVRLVPHEANGQPTPGANKDWNADFSARLARQALSWDLQLQPWVSEAVTPIEDASVNWPTPHVTVARLTLPTQDTAGVDGQSLAQRVEATVIDPWQALAAHRPLGDVQRARKVVYFESQKGRGAA